MDTTRRVARRRASAATALALLGLLGAACATAAPSATTGSGPPPSAASALPAVPPPPPLVWTSCPTHAGVECGTVAVPLDYAHPSAGTLQIAVSRIPASGGSAPDGTLVINPGGPGESGNQNLPIDYPLLPAAVRAATNVVSFDARGTGASSALQCGTNVAAVTSALPAPARAGQPLPGTPVFAGIRPACLAAAPVLTAQVDTVDTARDMDRIRQALGLSTVSFYGLSYGTVLGTAYASLFPHRLRAMVLDGVVDPYTPLAEQAVEQAPAAERSLVHLLDGCGAAPSCPLGAQPVRYFDQLQASMAARPLPAPGGGDTTPVTVGDLDTASLLAVSVPGFAPLYETALVSADHGNGSGLRSLALAFVVDIDSTPLVDAQWAITCNDSTGHTGPTAAGTLARTLGARYPMLGASMVNYNLGGCVAWPDGRRPVSELHPVGAPPVLLIGNTEDPNTPLIGAVHLAAAFPHASQLTWTGWGHTWLLNGSSDACVSGAVSRYLGGGGLPAPGTVCH